ncbi:MAG TPA: hypothetical protein VJ276_02700 [Thermoanaerobaculia bacterium]|nr:hypothetical protein [Thermoanaerobaculia bacterium]
MRRVFSLIAVLFLLSLSASNAYAARTIDSPRERSSPMAKILRLIVRAFGDEMSEPKP